MTKEPIFNLAEICAPIEGEHPTGSDIRLDKSPQSIYYRVRDARNLARSSERKALTGEEVPNIESQWEDTLALARTILINNTKDMEVLTWMIEALVRVEGLKGLTFGFQVAYHLIEQYWDGLFPLPEEGSYEYRLSAFSGLNGEDKEGTLIAPIRNLILVKDSQNEYALWQYKLALDNNHIVELEKRSQRIKELGFAIEDIEKAVDKTPSSYFKELAYDIDNAIEAYNTLSAQLDKLAPTMNIPSSNIKNQLAEFHDSLYILAATKINDAPNTVVDLTDNAAQGSTAQSHLDHREQAFALIAQASQYFRQNEPHSPISYMLERVTAWGRLSYPQLMQRIVADTNSLNQIYSLIGVEIDQ